MYHTMVVLLEEQVSDTLEFLLLVHLVNQLAIFKLAVRIAAVFVGLLSQLMAQFLVSVYLWSIATNQIYGNKNASNKNKAIAEIQIYNIQDYINQCKF